MIEAILDFLFSTLGEFVVDAIGGLFSLFGGGKRREADKDAEKTEHTDQD